MSIVAPSEDSARLRLRKALQLAPLFADLDANSMAAIERGLSLLVLPGGAPLFRQGEPTDAVYVVASGCLGVFRHEDEDSADEPILMAEIPPGNIVGEMSLLSHSQRTRSVAALRDSEVWRLARGSFDKLTALHPEVLPALMRNIAVRNAMGPSKRRRQPRTFALLPSGPDVPSARFAVLLAGALGRIGARVQMLGSESLNEDPEWFARCEMESSFVLYRADPTATEWTELCLRQADCLIVVRLGDDDRPTMLPFEIESAQTGAVFHRRRELVLLHEGHDPRAGSTAPLLAGGMYGQHHHVRLDLHSDFDRLARLITGHAVGVVMAGGGARSFGHVGAVRAMGESGVPIDLVGGTSMGAIVAAGVARAGRTTSSSSVSAGRFVEQSAERLHAAADLAVRRPPRHPARCAWRSSEKESRTHPAVLLRHRQPHDSTPKSTRWASCGAGCAPRWPFRASSRRSTRPAKSMSTAA